MKKKTITMNQMENMEPSHAINREIVEALKDLVNYYPYPEKKKKYEELIKRAER